MADGEVSEILLARYRGDLAEVERLRRERPQLDVFEAAALGDDGRLDELLTADPSLATAWSPDGFTPLHLAAFFGATSAAGRLVEAGADVGAVARNDMRVQPLHSAVAGRHHGIAQLLVEHGADPDAEQAGGFTPLGAALQHHDDEMVELLRSAGASDEGAPAPTS